MYPHLKMDQFNSNEGDRFILDARTGSGMGDQDSVGIDYKAPPNDVKRDDILLLDDGRVQLQVLSG